MVNIKRVLDIGAQSLLIPYVCSAEEAKAAVAATRYPPAGVRGVAGTTRATRFGRVKDYAKRAHEEICVLVQVETKPALDQLEAICAVEGVDGVFIGPADLHASMGYPGETANPAVLPLIEEAMRRIRKAGKAPGYLSPVEADAKRMLAAGCLFCAVGADVGLLARGAEALAREIQLGNHETRDRHHRPGPQGHAGAPAERVLRHQALGGRRPRCRAQGRGAHARRSRISATRRWTAS